MGFEKVDFKQEEFSFIISELEDDRDETLFMRPPSFRETGPLKNIAINKTRRSDFGNLQRKRIKDFLEAFPEILTKFKNDIV